MCFDDIFIEKYALHFQNQWMFVVFSLLVFYKNYCQFRQKVVGLSLDIVAQVVAIGAATLLWSLL